MQFNQDRAIYLQIADYITENILTAQWKENDRIPSTRELAVNIEVNPNTVIRTYTYLQEKGIIYNQRGIGYFIAPDAVNKTREFGRESFINEELPRIFKTMDLIGITIDELVEIHKKFRRLPREKARKPAKEEK